jgi:hypothetical protein
MNEYTRYRLTRRDNLAWLTAQGIVTTDAGKAARYDTYTGAILALLMNPVAVNHEWRVEPVADEQVAA